MKDTSILLRITFLLLIAAASLAVNAFRELVPPDEGRYAEIPREMAASGDWIVPHLNALPYVEKPPLQYWATATLYGSLGVHAWVSRLWTIALAIAGLAVVYLAGRKFWSERAGVFSALILISCPLYCVFAQINLLDMGLAFFIAAGLLAFLNAQISAEASLAERRWMQLCWSALGLAFLQKGLVAFALPVITLAVYCGVQRTTSTLRRLHLGWATAILTLVCAPWLVALWMRDPALVNYFLIHEHFTRFLTTEHHRVEPWWYFIPVILVGVLPWLPIVVPSLLRSLRRTAQFDIPLFLAIWACVVVVFFSLSGSKLAPYVLPAVAPLALLAGRWLDAAQDQRTFRGAVNTTFGFAAILITAAVAAPLLVSADRATTVGDIAPWVGAAGSIILIGAVLGRRLLRAERPIGAVAALGVGLYLGLTVMLIGANPVASARGSGVASRRLADYLTPNTRLYCVGTYLQTLPFELGRTCGVVDYTGELQLQFARDPAAREALSFDAFAALWRLPRHAAAVVRTDLVPRLSAAGLDHLVISRYEDFALVIKPAQSEHR